MPTKLVNKATGARDVIDDADVEGALASGKYIDPSAVAVHRLGEDTYAAPDLARSESAFTPTIDPAKVSLAQGHKIREDKNTGVGATLKAAAGGAASGLSFGLVDPFQDEQEFNRAASIGGQVAGAVAPAIFGDELGLTRAAELGADPITAEHAASSLSSKMLYTGEVGADAGTTGKALERGISKAGAALEEAKAAPSIDLAGMSKKELRASRDAELGRIEAERVPQRQALADDIEAYRTQTSQDKIFLATKDADVKGIGEVRKMAKVNLEADKMFDRALNKGTGNLGENLRPALGALQQQENALVKISKSETELRAVFAADESGTRAAALDAIPATLERNRALQQRIKALAAEPASEHLSAIGDALTGDFAAPKQGLFGQAVNRAVYAGATALASPFGHFAPAIGAKAAEWVSEVGIRRLGASVGEAATRTKAAVASFLDVTGRTVPVAPVLATKVLANVAFAPPMAKHADMPPSSKATQLADSYRKRSDELKSQVATGPDGMPQMRPEARAAMADRLAPIRAHNAILADRMETLGAKRLEYLASKIPRRPDLGVVHTGPDLWQPSDMEMRTWARHVSAVEDPGAIEERLAAGTVTPEDAEAYHTIYPERAAELKKQIIEQLATLKKTLPFSRRLALSIFAGVPVDASMDPRIMRVLQGQFQDEAGSEGGTQAPTANPQFGSIKKSMPEPTPAQHRQQG